MASGLLKSRHVKMRGSSVVLSRRAQVVSPVAQQGASGLVMPGVATGGPRGRETKDGEDGNVETFSDGFLGEPTSVLEQWSARTGRVRTQDSGLRTRMDEAIE
ncbi:hypothetical protein KCU62_g192, partial [Aureobasidium sp. EXF-3399]